VLTVAVKRKNNGPFVSTNKFLTAFPFAERGKDSVLSCGYHPGHPVLRLPLELESLPSRCMQSVGSRALRCNRRWFFFLFM
jgi:hypothetical protein